MFKPLASKVGVTALCPECSAILLSVNVVNRLNNATTIDSHLATYDVYFTEQPMQINTPFDPVPIEE